MAAATLKLQRGVCFMCKSLQNKVHVIKTTSARGTHKYTHVSISKSYNKYSSVYRDLHGTVDDQTIAKDFVYALKPMERNLLLSELQNFDLLRKTEGSEMKMLDSSGITPPTTDQLKRVFIHNALPFIGFGFLDNFLMITAGEYIDVTFGALLGISTMAAAALGNLLSDVCGVGSAHYIEVLCSRFGVRGPALKPDQVDMKQTRYSSNTGKAVGVSIGCFLGMFPLLFYGGAKDKEETS
ncbi:transmembrane protein 65-like isoform X1 [Mytilus galloprovincialis]|uniref:transmembrane protein 65-like isoform X1 n=1 Tax=Mytilus galloprovincialis TaxID=29158 RepID=UPI003F7C0FEE